MLVAWVGCYLVALLETGKDTLGVAVRLLFEILAQDMFLLSLLLGIEENM